MFEKIREMILAKVKANATPIKKPVKISKHVLIKAITKEIQSPEIQTPKEEKIEKSALKKICPVEEHNCIAIQLTNRLISMINEFEKNIERIENHPTLAEPTKLDIQNYINKNLITAIWALAPAFELMKGHDRLQTFKTIYTKAFKKGAPGILEDIKHI